LKMLTKFNIINVIRFLKAWRKLLYLTVVSNLAEKRFFDYFAQPRTLTQVVKRFGFRDRNYVELVLEGLVGVGALRKTKEGEYQLNPSSFKNGQPVFPKIDLENEEIETVYTLLNAPASLIWDRMYGKAASIEETTAPALFESMWGSKRMTTWIDVALSLGLKFKQLKKARNLLFVWVKNGENLAFLQLKMPWVKSWTAIDWNPRYLEIARREYKNVLKTMAEQLGIPPHEAKRPEPRILEMNPMNLSFDDEEFDTVYLEGGLYFLPDQQRAVDEIVRVTKRGMVVFGQNMVKTEGFLSKTADLWSAMLMTAEGASGLTTKKKLEEMFAKNGVKISVKTAVGFFAGLKPETG